MPSIQNEGVITPAIIHEEPLGIREAVCASPPDSDQIAAWH